MPRHTGSCRTVAPGRLTPSREAAGPSARIRPLRQDDLPDIVALRRRAFASGQRNDPIELAAYCDRVLLANPWRADDLPSLVYQNAQGRPVGFIGVIPRRMVFQGEPIRVAVATQMMVAPEERGLAGRQLVRAVLAGPQDLTLSDTANDPARRVWMSVGAQQALLYGFTWERVLRPWRRLRFRINERQVALRAAAYAARPLLAAGDAVARRMTPYQVGSPAGRREELDPDLLASVADRMLGDLALHPGYDAGSLSWLLAEAAEKKELGDFNGAMVRGVDGEIAGWYAYYGGAGRTAHVIQFVSRRATQSLVMDHLLHDASSTGAVTVSGRAEPALLPLLENPRYCLRHQAPWTLFYSRRPEIIHAIERGDAYISRLDGEWWLSF